MLFTSALFAWVYLPVVLAGFFAIGRWSEAGAALWLFLASLAFYAAWMPEFTLLLLASICFNFVIGRRIGASRSRAWLTFGVSANLLLLAYYKYAGFLVTNVNAVTGGNDALGDVRVVLEHEGRTFTGQSVAPDITEAAAEAFLRAAALVAAGIPNPMARESV